MIIILADTGQLGNKLLLLSNSLATVIKKNDKLITYSFNEYEKYFNIYKSNKIIKKDKTILNNKVLKRIIIKLLNILYDKNIKNITKNIQIVKNINDISQYNKKNKYIIIDWAYRDTKNLILFKEEINNIISIKDEYKVDIDLKIKKYYEKYDILIGVHIRRGDYKEWKDGKYYFSFNQYNRILNKINIIGIYMKVGLLSNVRI